MLENEPNPTTDSTLNPGTLSTFEFSQPLTPADLPAPSDGYSMSELGPYKIGRELGRGAMGVVYEAVHTQLQRTVALKVLPLELAASGSRLKRFRREMAAIGRLDHPNIVLATDAGEEHGLCYIAMQFINGRDLEAILGDIGRFEPADACEIARQTALGLQHIHEQRLVHRDIKPSNIVLAKTGDVKILDLGIAMLRNAGQRETAMTMAGSMMGTPDYIAPEQITECCEVDIRADIYSLGCTLHGLLSGKPPFNGPGYTTFTAKLVGHAEHVPAPLGDLCPEIPQGIVKLVERMMSKNPDDRPDLPMEVANSLEEFSREADLAPVASGQIKQRKLPAQRDSIASPSKSASGRTFGQRNLILGAIAACALLAGAIGFGFKDNPVPTSTDAPFNVEKKRRASDDLVANLADLETLVDTFAPTENPTPRKNSTKIETDIPQLGGLFEQIQRTIAESTETVAESTETIAESNVTIAENTAHIADTLEELRRQFNTTQGNRVAIANPSSPADHYFNAQAHSLRGDYLKARRSFLAYFANELPVVDPHLQFIQLLKLQEGVAGARELYAEIPGDKKTPSRRLATALLHSADARTTFLEQLIKDESKFAPAWYHLSREFSADRNPHPTLSIQVREKELLEEFMRLHESGNLLKYFLDQSKAVTMVTDVERRLKRLESVNLDAAADPVKLTTAIPSGTYWRISMEIAEPAIEILYRFGEDGEFKSTGSSGVFIGGVELSDPRTGKPRPRSYFEYPGKPNNGTMHVKYVDASGQIRGPFPLKFELDSLHSRWQRTTLEAGKSQWLHLENGNLVFAVFNYGRDPIKSVVYGLNEEVPTRAKSVPRGPVDDVNYSEFIMPVPASVEFATIQVTFNDGTKSEIVKIGRAH